MNNIVEKLESYGFECEAGPLENCVDWNNLKAELAKEREESRRGFENDETIASLRLKLEAAEDLAKGWDLLAVKRGESLEAAEAQVVVLSELLTRVDRIARNSRQFASGHNCEGTAGCQAIHDIARSALKDLPAHAAKYQAAWESIKTARQVMYDAPELNMSNYDHDQVAELNTAMCEAYGIIDTAVRQLKED